MERAKFSHVVCTYSWSLLYGLLSFPQNVPRSLFHSTFDGFCFAKITRTALMNILHVFCLPIGMLSLRSFRLISNSTSSYLCILSTENNGMHHHTQLLRVSLKPMYVLFLLVVSLEMELLFQGQVSNISSRCTSKVLPKTVSLLTAQTEISSCFNTWHSLQVSLHILWLVSELFPRRMVFRL